MTRHPLRLAGAALALLLPIVALGTLAPTYADPPGAAAPDDPLVSPSPTVERLRVEQTPAPRVAARATGMKAFPVPTSSAGLRRITTAPDGAMWFVEEDTNKIGRITATGAITEYTLPPTTTSDGRVIDLDVDPHGRVWVVWDSGWKVGRFTPGTNSIDAWEFAYPYGEEIRVGAGATWVTMSYDVDGLVRIVGDDVTWHPNAPECDDALGVGRDGAMWCQQFNKLVRINADGSGGVSHPLPADAVYPHSVATGPNHRIWFGRDSGGTMFTSPGRGDIGWITQTNKVRTTKLGLRVAPRSLVTGRDGNVWFTSVGAAKGIGHVTKDGKRGAIAKVGNYRPTSLTYGRDGNIWFTDAENNVIVRVGRDRLWATNVNVGEGSRLKPRKQPKAKVKGQVDADKKRKKATVRIACAKGGKAKVPCQGRVVVKAGKKKVAKGSYAVAKKNSVKVTVKLNGKARTLLQKKSAVAVQVILKPASGGIITSRTKLTR